MSFNVGDFVRLKTETRAGTVFDKNDKHLTGKVITLKSYSNYVGVEFIKPIIRGHMCDGAGKDKYCYFCYENELELDPKKNKSEFKIKEEVVFIDGKLKNKKTKNKLYLKGTIKRIFYNYIYLVEVKNKNRILKYLVKKENIKNKFKDYIQTFNKVFFGIEKEKILKFIKETEKDNLKIIKEILEV